MSAGGHAWRHGSPPRTSVVTWAFPRARRSWSSAGKASRTGCCPGTGMSSRSAVTDRGRLVRAGRVVVRDTRRLTLAGCAGLLLAVAFAAPLPHDEVLDSAGVSLAFF